MTASGIAKALGAAGSRPSREHQRKCQAALIGVPWSATTPFTIPASHSGEAMRPSLSHTLTHGWLLLFFPRAISGEPICGAMMRVLAANDSSADRLLRACCLLAPTTLVNQQWKTEDRKAP